MKAVWCKAWGPPEALVVEDVEAPRPGPGEVRVRVHACGVNFADTLIVQGLYQERPAFPFTPGLEAAGKVVEIGAGVMAPAVGERVVAVGGIGGYAEELVTRAERVVAVPETMDLVTAAAFPVAYGTAHVALAHRAGLRDGETLLVHGAGGGVGLAAVEVGKCLGATVIATAGAPDKLELARSRGADHVVNHRDEAFRDRVDEITRGRGADVIFDPVGGDVFAQSLHCIAWEGRLLTIGFASGKIPDVPAGRVLVKNVSVVGVYWGAYAERDPAVLTGSLATLFDWYASGRLHPHVAGTWPLARAGEALRLVMERGVAGKIVLRTG